MSYVAAPAVPSRSDVRSPTSTEVRSPTSTATEVRSPTSTSTEVRSPTSTSTEVRSPTSTTTDAYTSGNVTVTGGAGAGANTTVNICASAPWMRRPDVRQRGRGARPSDWVPGMMKAVNEPRVRSPMPFMMDPSSPRTPSPMPHMMDPSASRAPIPDTMRADFPEPVMGLGCGCDSVRGLGASMNQYDATPPEGVPNPYGIRYHAYPTRFHGPIYTRPMFGFPWHEAGVNWGELRRQMSAYPQQGQQWGNPAKFGPASGLGDTVIETFGRGALFGSILALGFIVADKILKPLR